MGSYACIRTDNMSGTIDGKNLVSLRYSGTIENGTVVKVGGFATGEREVRSATLAANTDKVSDLAIIATPEVIKDKSYYNISDFINKDGDICRGYRICANDIFSVTRAAFASGQTPASGNLVEVDGSGKFIAVSTPTSLTGGGTAETIGTILAVEGDWYVIQVGA